MKTLAKHGGTPLQTALKAMAAAALAMLGACAPVPRTADQDPAVPQMAVNGHALHVQHFGRDDAPVVVVLHGGPGADFRYLLGLQALAAHFQVVFYDQLGSGLSQRVPATEITVDGFLRDLDAIVAHYGQGRKVHLVGHSWGAMLATAYAGRHPDLVDRMVLAEPGFLDQETLADLPGGWPGWRVIAAASKAWLLKWTISTHNDAYARDDWFMLQLLPVTQRPSELCNGQLPPLQAWRFGSPAFEATIGRMSDATFARTLNFTQGLRRYQGPVLFLHGACNTLQGEATQRKMMQRFVHPGQARLATIAEAGHFMVNDQPERSVAAIDAFLRQARTPAPGP